LELADEDNEIFFGYNKKGIEKKSWLANPPHTQKIRSLRQNGVRKNRIREFQIKESLTLKLQAFWIKNQVKEEGEGGMSECTW
jgi:hypothetical protein